MRDLCHLSQREYDYIMSMSKFTKGLRSPQAKRFEAKSIVFVAFDGIQMLDLVGPLEVFHGANQFVQATNGANSAPYSISVASFDGTPVVASNGFKVDVNVRFKQRSEEIDTLIVPGALNIERILEFQSRLRDPLQRMAAKCRRVATICSGAFLLAETGLLDQRRVTTHWAGSELLKKKYPLVKVESDNIYLRDGRYYTSGGATAGMDLALALVEEDLGSQVALELARWFVMYVKRPGGQAQFSTPLKGQFATSQPIITVTQWIAANPTADCSVESLARLGKMSPRNFARMFSREVGMTPAKFVLHTRLEVACRMLIDLNDGLKTIARQSGFSSEESLRRAFQKHFTIAPGEYRSRFRVRQSKVIERQHRV
jgi:transcriptional regulator GlxA family with amidase domain